MPLIRAAAWAAGEALHWLRHPRLPPSNRGKGIAAAVVAAVLLVAGGASAGGYFLDKALTGLPGDAAFAVGEQVVTTKELENKVDTLHALYGVQPPSGHPKKMDTFRRDAAKHVAVSIVIHNEAGKRGLSVSQKQARNWLDKYVQKTFGPGQQGHDAFVKKLGDAGTNYNTVLDEIQRRLTKRKLFAKITKNVSVSQAELRKDFPKYKDALATPEQRHLYNIVVTTKDQAKKIVDKLASGASFQKLAKKDSLDGSTKSKGGDMGKVAKSQLQDAYAKAAFATKKGHVFGPVESTVQGKNVWNVGKVVGVTSGKPATYASSKKQLKQIVQYKKAFGRWDHWLGGAIQNADIRYAEEYRPAHPDEPPGKAALGQAKLGAPPSGAGPGSGPGSGKHR
jgi:peptidyl-prolyl cis-trans isomerase C